MPTLDGGQLFLTVLAPIIVGDDVDPVSGAARSHRHLLAQKLATLPTGRQTARSPADAPPSPFARNSLNHFARFVVIDGPAYNGRKSGNTLVDAIRKVEPLVPQRVDALPCPYLLFAADVDAQSLDETAARRAYTDALWATMRGELQDIMRHCRGFAKVASAEAFHDYIRDCQVETTMPFHDYWPDDDLTRAKTGLRTPALIIGAVLVVALVAIGWIAHAHHWRWFTAVPAFAAAVALAVFALYRTVLGVGARLFPTPPAADLAHVLKALFLQQSLARFAVETQGEDDAALHAAFGRFLAAVRPDAAEPSQPPGAVWAPGVSW